MLEHEDADERIVNELFGFVMRCATQSAAHLTDYVINYGTAVSIAGVARAKALLAFGMYAGYLVEIETDDDVGRARKAYKIVEDPEFIHLRTKAEIEWERERRNDVARPELVIPVRLRDGDGCRYCGKVVRWASQNSALGGTYDHRIPGKRAKDENDMFVSCRGCNSGRKNSETADVDYPRLPVPTRAFFSESTVNWLKDHDYVKRLRLKVPRPSGRALQPGDPTGNGPTGQQQSNGASGSAPTGDGNTGQNVQGDGTTGPNTAGNGTSGQHDLGNGTTGPAVHETPAIGSSPIVAPEGNGTAHCTEETVQVSAMETPLQPAQTQGSDPSWQHVGNPANSLTEGPGIRGSGRDGTGRVGQGRSPAPKPKPAAHRLSSPNLPGIPQPSTQGKKNRRRARPRNRKGKPNA